MERLKRRYVLLGRDGVINRRVVGGYVLTWEQFEFLPRALDALRLFADNGYKVLVVIDRQCVERGLLSPHELQRLTQRFLLEVALAGGNIERVYDGTRALSNGCRCRMSRSSLLLQAMAEHGLRAAEIHVISDSAQDLEAASVAGCPTILLRRDAFLIPGVSEDGEYEANASSLHEAAVRIVGRHTATLEEALRSD